ncbi:hypothetical protein DUNSADRAFT_14118 [Dunaliella salina]|uniref:Plastid lipid-associated protein/fibrillin conserved domain-containing protein n=1 Tax=Dunaliella salina TaxID=3046 RepID=A0ABQ7G7Y4_DUNSA|nr:hypothetical protein DUNSADRAFT_14118 [Dunaliella salina]|eukprot:KAF5830712.1 hypothetical protein DUNSADRAFT_14118 [Dunaliella salina]
MKAHMNGLHCAMAGRNACLAKVSPRPIKRCVTAKAGFSLPFLSWQPTLKKQRDELLSMLLLEDGSSTSSVNALIDELAESKSRFSPSSLGRGPWVVVYTHGPAQLWKASQSVATSLSRSRNQASQEFDPKTKAAINRAEFGSPDIFVTASGTFEVQGEASSLPVTVQANINEGRLHFFGRELPLPIKGKGLFTILYIDDKVRIFRSGNSYAVQVQQGELQKYLDSRRG